MNSSKEGHAAVTRRGSVSLFVPNSARPTSYYSVVGRLTEDDQAELIVAAYVSAHTDDKPGNHLIDAQARVWLVDLDSGLRPLYWAFGDYPYRLYGAEAHRDVLDGWALADFENAHRQFWRLRDDNLEEFKTQFQSKISAYGVTLLWSRRKKLINQG